MLSSVTSVNNNNTVDDSNIHSLLEVNPPSSPPSKYHSDFSSQHFPDLSQKSEFMDSSNINQRAEPAGENCSMRSNALPFDLENNTATQNLFSSTLNQLKPAETFSIIDNFN